MTVVEKIAEAIRDAEKCPEYAPERGEPCDGLLGCGECLRGAAEAALAVLRLELPRSPIRRARKSQT